MPTFASDSFGSANGTELSAHNAAWKKISGLTGNAQIANGRLRPSSTTTPAYYYDAAPGSADYSVSADFTTLSGADSAIGILARASSSAATHYRLLVGTTSFATIGKFVSGSFTTITSFSPGMASGETANFRLELIGSALKVYKNGSTDVLASATDSSISAAGFAGVRAFSSVTPGDAVGVHIDNFLAYTGSPGSPTPTGITVSASNITSSTARITATLSF